MAEVPGGTGEVWDAVTRLGTSFGVTFAVLASIGLAACGTPQTGASVAQPEATALRAGPPAPLPPAREGIARDVNADVAALVNMSQYDLIAAFGSPDFTRRDAPAEIWQYRSAACVLDVFFYPEGRDMRVAYAATRSRGVIKVAENTCFPSLPALPHTRSADARHS